jgi:hypothetical protein
LGERETSRRLGPGNSSKEALQTKQKITTAFLFLTEVGMRNFFLIPQSQFRNLKETLPQSQFRNFLRNVAPQPQWQFFPMSATSSPQLETFTSAIFGIFFGRGVA